MNLIKISLQSAMIMATLLANTTYASWHQTRTESMGTELYMEFWHTDLQKANALMSAVIAEMNRLDNLLSPYKKSSELTQINNMQGGRKKIGVDSCIIIDQSLYFSRLTGGAFDISFASIGKLYHYRSSIKPSDAEIKANIKTVDFNAITLLKKESSYLKCELGFSRQKVQLDLGGIAKGYAVDNAIKILSVANVKNAIVSAGGESRIIGDRRGRPWNVGIRHPRASQQTYVITVPLENVAISTSGDYERFFIEDGKRYHHILNPRTGKSDSELMSVTILADTSMEADALSTSVFVMGLKAGMALINSRSNTSAIIIDRAGNSHYSDDLEALQ